MTNPFVFVVGLLHYLSFIFIALYPLFFSKSKWDIVYIYYTIAVIIQWTLFDGYCIIAVLLNKPDSTNNYTRDTHVLPVSEKVNELISQLIYFFWMYGMYRVYTRNRYPLFIPIVFILCYILYDTLLYMYDKKDKTKSPDFQKYQRMILYGLLFVLGATIYYTL